MRFRSSFFSSGPGSIISAAFIGPGTVTVCSVAGAKYGISLVWAVGLSVLITVVLQRMVVTLSITSGKNLVELIKSHIPNTVIRLSALTLAVGAITLGNAGYEAGNISGALLGLDLFIPIQDSVIDLRPLMVGLLAFAILWFGRQKHLEIILGGLVSLMGIAFVITAILALPYIAGLPSELLLPSLPKDGFLTVLGLIGTTVVPYNLFLHSYLVNQKWQNTIYTSEAIRDTKTSIIRGGVITLSIVIAAAVVQSNTIQNAYDLSKALEPVLGKYAVILMGIGLLSAGITSAITAPLAASYVICSAFGWDISANSSSFRLITLLILSSGVLVATLQLDPIIVIQLAQALNGILLPIAAAFVLWLFHKQGHRKAELITGIVMIFVLIILGFKGFNIF